MAIRTELARDVLVSIRPFYASKILDGRKTVELRRRFPEVGTVGALALIYSSSPVRAIVGYARIKMVLKLPLSQLWKEHGTAACISKKEFDAYFVGLRFGFAIVLEGVGTLKRELKAAELEMQLGIVPPQSYRYVTDDCIALLDDDRFQIPYRYEHHNRPRRRSARRSVSC
jgi:predicted transcriptional regulator